MNVLLRSAFRLSLALNIEIVELFKCIYTCSYSVIIPLPRKFFFLCEPCE